MKIAVTGATGYIGTQLLIQLQAKGHEPIALSRTPPKFTCAWQYYDLHSDEIIFTEKVNGIVHLAMNFNLESAEDVAREKRATLKLLEACDKNSTTFLYVSSQTATKQATTLYGQTKWEIEQIVLAHGGKVVRPGMVYGGELKGLYGGMVQSLERTPVAPWIIPAPSVQPIHVADLCVGIITILESPASPTQIFELASEQKIPFDKFIHGIAKYRLQKKLIFLPIPVFAIKLLHFLLPGNKQVLQLCSLITLPPMSTGNQLKSLNLSLRSLPEGLFYSGDFQRRQLLIEAYSFLHYLLDETPPLSLVKTYIKAVKCISSGDPLHLPPLFYKFPFLLGFINPSTNKNKQFAKEFSVRLDFATAIAEASTLGARKFLRINKKRSFIASSIIIFKAVFMEIFQRLLGTFATPILLGKLPALKDSHHE